MLYLVLAGVFCFFYYKKVILTVDLDSVSSLNAVAGFNTYKPFQFRLLIPLLFLLLKPFGISAGKTVLLGFSTIVVYLILVVQYKILCEYFQNKKLMLLFTVVILYPMAWNYILLNQAFLYYDFTAILLFSLGFYFILREKFAPLIIVFLFGLLNKETIAYLAIAYMFFNYRALFTKKIIQNIAIFAVIFLIYKLILSYVFRGNPGDSVEICFLTNMWILEDLFANTIYTKDVFLNFGGLYIFVILLFATGAWKKFPDRRKVLINLTLLVYFMAGVFIVYLTEVRVYTELMPMITTMFLLFLSSFEKLNFQPIPANG